MASRNGNGLRKLAWLSVVVGVVFLLFCPEVVYRRAHERAQAFQCQTRGFIPLQKADEGEEYLFETAETGELVPMARPCVVESSNHRVFETVADGSTGRFDGRFKVLSNGYIDDFRRVPAICFILSSLLAVPGALLIILRRRLQP